MNEKSLNDLFRAYYSTRKNKRNTFNALKFERNFESQLLALFDEMINRTYEPRASIAFVVNNPVKREIFAADFRDRVIHHFIYNYLAPIFEKVFIHDSYSCRKGKGVHYGVKRADHFIRSGSENYSQDAYILKLDIKGYFMSINKQILFEKIDQVLSDQRRKINFDYSLVRYLVEKIIFNEPIKDCIIKGNNYDWNDLPKSKSLFGADSGCGLPIGNLTSQLFGNVYLNDFDHFIKHKLKIKHYGRYVDDFIIVHRNKEYLKSLIPTLDSYLKQELCLTLHPKKIYLQPVVQGVRFLGVMIKPHRIYIANRIKGNFQAAINRQNEIVSAHTPAKEELNHFLSVMNSCLGMMVHYQTANLRQKMVLQQLSDHWKSCICFDQACTKLMSNIRLRT